MDSTAPHTSTTDEPIDGPDPSELRRRADRLVRLANQIERSPVMTLPDRAHESTWHTSRARLCSAMLERNVHQLHCAADDLRMTAFRIRSRADELESTVGSAA